MKRSATIVWWCSLAFTLFMLGSMIYPALFPDRSWGNWKNLVGLEVPSGEVKRFDFYPPFDGGSGTTWFLCRTDGDWIRKCVQRFGLEVDGNTGDEELMRRMGAFDKWGESPEISCWTKMEGGPFLWKDGLRPSRKEDEFHYRVFLLFSPDRQEAILGLDRVFARGNETVLPLDIAEGGEGWMTTVERSIPKFLFGGFILVAFGLCVFVPCLLVWLPVFARVRKFPENPGKGLKFWYYAGTAVASLLFCSCSMVLIMLEDSVSGAILLFPVMALGGMAVMLFIAQECLSLQRKKAAALSEISSLPPEE